MICELIDKKGRSVGFVEKGYGISITLQFLDDTGELYTRQFNLKEKLKLNGANTYYKIYEEIK